MDKWFGIMWSSCSTGHVSPIAHRFGAAHPSPAYESNQHGAFRGSRPASDSSESRALQRRYSRIEYLCNELMVGRNMLRRTL